MAKRPNITRSGSLEGIVADALSELQSLRDEMSEWRDNMEEKLSHTDKYERVSECVDLLDGFCDNEPTIPTNVPKGLLVEMTWEEPPPKKRQSRYDRLSAAVGDIRMVQEHVQEFVDNHEDGDALWTDEVSRDDWEQYATDLGDLCDEAEGVEFPGMYG